MKVTLTRQVTNVRLGGILAPGEHEVSEAEAKHYRRMGWTDQEPEPEPVLAPVTGQVVPVVINSEILSEHHLQRIRVAKEISGRDGLTVEEADEILREELQRRGEPASTKRAAKKRGA
jgi:hypothetical protein